MSSENERLKATVKGPDEDADALGEEVLADVLRDLDTAAINRANTHDMVFLLSPSLLVESIPVFHCVSVFNGYLQV